MSWRSPSSKTADVDYWTLKYVHIIGAAVLLGTGAGIAFFMVLGHRTGKPDIIAAIARIVVVADFVFTATAVVAQPVTGALLAWHLDVPMSRAERPVPRRTWTRYPIWRLRGCSDWNFARTTVRRRRP
jgi:hypothetical protein